MADQADALQQLSLPVGWGGTRWSDFKSHWWWTVPGWLLTAFLVMLGGPFWFELLSRLGSLRVSGSKPAAAVDDDSSATSLLAAHTTRVMSAQTGQQQSPQPAVPLGNLDEALKRIHDFVAPSPVSGLPRPRAATRAPGVMSGGAA